MEHKPHITLLGAGPGDPELITVKGANALKSADAILYDALVHPKLLEYAPDDVPKIFVGKRANKHRYSQEEINRMLVAYAFNYGHVVRLKGGDPYVFGRGYEEREYAEVFDIPVRVISGLSSAIAVPATQGIPLTARGVNESFWVMTATRSDGSLTSDIQLAIQSSATVVILMGVRKLRAIAGLFCEKGRKDLPVAVVQSGTTAQERFVVGTMNDIADRAEDASIGTPGIIVAGATVGLHSSFGDLAASIQLNSIISRNGRKEK